MSIDVPGSGLYHLHIANHSEAGGTGITRHLSPVRAAARKTRGEEPTRPESRRAAEHQRQAKIQKGLYEIAKAAGKAKELHKFYAVVERNVGHFLPAAHFRVWLHDPAAQVLTPVYPTDERGQVPSMRCNEDQFYQTAHGRVLQTGKVFFLTGKEIEAGGSRDPFTPPGMPAEDWLGLPLKSGKQTIGMMTLQCNHNGLRHDKQDVRALEMIAQQVSSVLALERAFNEIHQQEAELSIISCVQAGLASKLEMEDIYRLIGENVREVFKVQVVDIVHYDPDSHLISMPYSYEKGDRTVISPREPYGFRLQVIQSGKPLLINHGFIELAAKSNNPLLTGDWPKSALFMPLAVNGKVSDIISIQDMERENAFGEKDVRLMETLANSMGVALENARLWEQEKIFRQALQRELDIGREIQTGFIPEVLPVVEGWEIAASLMSAREVAGDFYDAFVLPAGNIGLVIADVCDKGVGAALFMTLFRSLIRAASNLDYYEHKEQENVPQATSELLQRAISLTNNYIAETHGESGMFATLFFGILEPREGNLVYINGGHEPPLILRAGAVHEVLHTTGPAVGVNTNGRFELGETKMERGDIFFAFTDGVPDCKNLEDESFGHERLFEVLQKVREPVRNCVKHLEEALHEYIGGATQFDDIAMLAVCRGS